jgi:hypothetical protein
LSCLHEKILAACPRNQADFKKLDKNVSYFLPGALFLLKAFAGGPGGRFSRKEPLAAGGNKVCFYLLKINPFMPTITAGEEVFNTLNWRRLLLFLLGIEVSK